MAYNLDNNRSLGNVNNRHSIRLLSYDYSQDGAYFVTLVTAGCDSIFSKVSVGEMALGEFGDIVRDITDYTRTARYIANNPPNWKKDEENLWLE
jgi:hypothetical protein